MKKEELITGDSFRVEIGPDGKPIVHIKDGVQMIKDLERYEKGKKKWFGIFTREEYEKHKKLIIITLLIFFLAGIIAGFILDPSGEAFLRFIHGL